MWQDKYRPRKPRYFNRVHTGYEWNKYNQTHYDSDNPPPKVVQGYKFNIFYPDLLDKSKAPTYIIEREPDTNETVFIRFKAGPPYEVSVVRIWTQVNHWPVSWEYFWRGDWCSSNLTHLRRILPFVLSTASGNIHIKRDSGAVSIAASCSSTSISNGITTASNWSYAVIVESLHTGESGGCLKLGGLCEGNKKKERQKGIDTCVCTFM